MSQVFINQEHLTAIANAIRTKTGTSSLYSPAVGMPQAIMNIATPTDGTISIKTVSDISISGSIFTIPEGYYITSINKTATQIGSITPSLSISEMENNQITIAPVASYDEGYIMSGSLTGIATTISANQLTSGTSYITSEGTYNVINYSNVNINAPAPTSGLSFIDILGRYPGSSYYNSITVLTSAQATYLSYNSYTQNLYLPNCTTISSYAVTTPGIKSLNCPICTVINSNAFRYCTTLETAIFPECISIYDSAFYQCSNLQTISFPKCTIISSSAFNYCESLVSAIFPSCIEIGTQAFYYCRRMQSASFPMCQTIQNYGFNGCAILQSIFLPSCITIGSYGFAFNYSLSTISLPVCTTINTGAFSYCSSLQSISLPKCINLAGSSIFTSAALQTLYIGTDINTVCTLGNSNTFASTLISQGSIYVPNSLVTNYKAATNWTYFASRIFGI